MFCLTDGAARIFLPPYAVARIQTHVELHLKLGILIQDDLPTELPQPWPLNLCRHLVLSVVCVYDQNFTASGPGVVFFQRSKATTLLLGKHSSKKFSGINIIVAEVNQRSWLIDGAG